MLNHDILEVIFNGYMLGIKKSRVIRTIQGKAKKDTLTIRDIQDAAGEAGKILGNTLADIMSKEAKGGRIPLADALLVVPPSLRRNYEFIKNMIKAADKNGYLPYAVPKFDTDRANNLAKHIAGYEYFEEHKADFRELVENNSRSIVDDAVSTTADARWKMGFTPKITRSQAGECCSWCAEVAGTYDYDPRTIDKKIFRRHRGCDCLIEIFRDGEHEAVNNYMKYDRRIDAEDVKKRIRRVEELSRDPYMPSHAELIRRWEAGKKNPNNQGIIAGKILNGEFNLKYKHQKYIQHLRGTKQYEKTAADRGRPQSYLTISESEAQKLIYELCGRGVLRSEEGSRLDIEFVDAAGKIGEFMDVTKKWEPTNRMAIHYGRDGAHIVPVKPLKKEGIIL